MDHDHKRRFFFFFVKRSLLCLIGKLPISKLNLTQSDISTANELTYVPLTSMHVDFDTDDPEDSHQIPLIHYYLSSTIV